MHKLLVISAFAVFGVLYGINKTGDDVIFSPHQSTGKTSFRQVRHSLNLSQEQIAQDLQVNQDVIEYMEESEHLGSDMRYRLEKKYGVLIN